MPNISVIPFHYRRPENLEPQLESIQKQSVDVDEIIIGHLESDEYDYNFPDGMKVVHFHKDPGLRAKFITALTSSFDTDFVFIIDDDIILGKKSIENILNSYSEKPGVYGGLGFELEGENWYEHRAGREPKPHGQNESIKKVDFIGHSWFLKREWVSLYLSEPCPLDVFSGTDDIWFSYVMWKNSIDSYSPPNPPNKPERWPDKDIRSQTSGQTLNQYYDDHISDRKKIIKYCKERGWPDE